LSNLPQSLNISMYLSKLTHCSYWNRRCCPCMVTLLDKGWEQQFAEWFPGSLKVHAEHTNVLINIWSTEVQKVTERYTFNHILVSCSICSAWHKSLWLCHYVLTIQMYLYAHIWDLLLRWYLAHSVGCVVVGRVACSWACSITSTCRITYEYAASVHKCLFEHHHAHNCACHLLDMIFSIATRRSPTLAKPMSYSWIDFIRLEPWRASSKVD